MSSNAVMVQLTMADFDKTDRLDEFPEDFECPLCMMIKQEVVECPKCSQQSCRDCNVAFTNKQGKGNPNQNHFECTTCH